MTWNGEDWLLLAAEHGPSAAKALAILMLGWLIAWVARWVVRKLIDALWLRQRIDKSPPPETVPEIVFYLVLLLFVPPIVEALQVKALEPARKMVEAILQLVPNLLGALVVFFTFFLLARILQRLTANLSALLGVDRVPAKLGLTEKPATPRPSTIVGHVVLTILTTLGVIRALNALEIKELSTLFESLLEVLIPLFEGWIVFAIGLILGQLAHRGLAPAGESTKLAWLTRAAIIVSTSALALRSASLENDLLTYAYGVTMTSAALAFGLGGREAAARLIAQWRTENEAQPSPARGR